MGKPIGNNRAKKEQENQNNFPSVIQQNNSEQEEQPLKSILIKVEASTHKKLMQTRTDKGITMNDYINSAIINQLNKDSY